MFRSWILELENDIEVVGEAHDGRQAVALAKKHRPDVVLMDISMPLLNGLRATRQVLKEVPATKVLMLSALNDDAYVKTSIESWAVGYYSLWVKHPIAMHGIMRYCKR